MVRDEFFKLLPLIIKLIYKTETLYRNGILGSNKINSFKWE